MRALGPELETTFRNDGFVVVPGLLDANVVRRYVSILDELALAAKDGPRGEAMRAGAGLGTAWTLPDGVTRTPRLWDVIDAPEVVDTVRSLLGDGVRFLRHTDVHVGFSALDWHRDSVNRRFGAGPDWNEDPEPYSLVRVGIYLQSYRESGFRLGLVPGSHGRGSHEARSRRLDRFARLPTLVYSRLGGVNPLEREARWVEAELGDAVFFDPRILHAGSSVSGPKYSLFLAYGVPNGHFARHQEYFTRVRSDLGYGEMPEELSRRLSASGLLPPSLPEVEVVDAFRPPRWLDFVLKRAGVRAAAAPVPTSSRNRR